MQHFVSLKSFNNYFFPFIKIIVFITECNRSAIAQYSTCTYNLHISQTLTSEIIY